MSLSKTYKDWLYIVINKSSIVNVEKFLCKMSLLTLSLC